MSEPERAAIHVGLDTVLAMEGRAWRVSALEVTVRSDQLCLHLGLMPLTSGPDPALATLPAVACGATLTFERPGGGLDAVLVTKCLAQRRLVWSDRQDGAVAARIEHGGEVHGCDALSVTRERLERARLQEGIQIGMEVGKQALDEERGA